MPFTLTRIIADKLLDERVTEINVCPMWSGGALVSYMAADRVHYAWYWPLTGEFKVLSDDLFDADWKKDAGGFIWDTPRGLACLLSHTTDATGSGASARLYGGTMDASWVVQAREYQLTALIDDRALAIVQSAQGGSTDQDTIAALQATVNDLEGRLNALQARLDSAEQRMGQAGAVLGGG